MLMMYIFHFDGVLVTLASCVCLLLALTKCVDIYLSLSFCLPLLFSLAFCDSASDVAVSCAFNNYSGFLCAYGSDDRAS